MFVRNLINFETLNVGDFFVYDHTLYLKVNNSKDEVNAVAFQLTSDCCFHHENKVEKFEAPILLLPILLEGDEIEEEEESCKS